MGPAPVPEPETAPAEAAVLARSVPGQEAVGQIGPRPVRLLAAGQELEGATDLRDPEEQARTALGPERGQTLRWRNGPSRTRPRATQWRTILTAKVLLALSLASFHEREVPVPWPLAVTVARAVVRDFCPTLNPPPTSPAGPAQAAAFWISLNREATAGALARRDGPVRVASPARGAAPDSRERIRLKPDSLDPVLT